MREREPTVFVVDDDSAVLKSLEMLMKSVRLDVETCSTAQDFLQNCDPSRPGCLLLDVRMPQMSGLQLYKHLRDKGCGIPTIFLTGHGDVPTAVKAMQDGAFDYLEKPVNEQHLLDRVYAAIAWDRDNRQGITERRLFAERLQSLSSRESEVLDRMLDGKTSKAIALELGIGLKTVDFHRANIMRKAGVDTVAELVYLLVKGGYSRTKSHKMSQGAPA